MTIRIKRRAGGASGAPSSLQNAELAFNEADDTLYIGKGTGGAGGSATTVEPIGGNGAFVSKTGDQTIAGTKTFSSPIVGDIQGSANTLANPRWIILDGDVIGQNAFDGSANTTITVELDEVLAGGSFGASGKTLNVTVDAKGRVIAISAVDIINAAVGTKGIASFSGDYFIVTSGDVSLKDGGVSNAKLANSSFTIGTTTVSLGGTVGTLSGLSSPVNASDAATRQYVDNAVQGLDAKQSVLCATTADIALSGTQTIDGVNATVGSRVLVKNQTDAYQNGIYVVAAGAWSRSTDADSWNELVQAFVFVEEGTANANKSFVCNNVAGGSLGATNVTWVSFGTAVTLDPTLAAIATLVTAADQFIYATGVDSFAMASLSAFMRGLLGSADLAALKTALEIGTIASQAANNVAITGGSISDGVTVDGGTF